MCVGSQEAPGILLFPEKWKSSKPKGADDIYLENWPLKHEWLRKVGVGLGGSKSPHDIILRPEPLDPEYGSISRAPNTDTDLEC